MRAWRPPRCSALSPASRACTAARAASAAALTRCRTTATCEASPRPHWASATSSVCGKELWCRRGLSTRPTPHTIWSGDRQVAGSGGVPPGLRPSPAHLPLCHDPGHTPHWTLKKSCSPVSPHKPPSPATVHPVPRPLGGVSQASRPSWDLCSLRAPSMLASSSAAPVPVPPWWAQPWSSRRVEPLPLCLSCPSWSPLLKGFLQWRLSGTLRQLLLWARAPQEESSALGPGAWYLLVPSMRSQVGLLGWAGYRQGWRGGCQIQESLPRQPRPPPTSKILPRAPISSVEPGSGVAAGSGSEPSSPCSAGAYHPVSDTPQHRCAEPAQGQVRGCLEDDAEA